MEQNISCGQIGPRLRQIGLMAISRIADKADPIKSQINNYSLLKVQCTPMTSCCSIFRKISSIKYHSLHFEANRYHIITILTHFFSHSRAITNKHTHTTCWYIVILAQIVQQAGAVTLLCLLYITNYDDSQNTIKYFLKIRRNVFIQPPRHKIRMQCFLIAACDIRFLNKRYAECVSVHSHIVILKRSKTVSMLLQPYGNKPQ